MPTYEYEILEGPATGQIIEIEQKISAPALEVVEFEGTNVRAKRVIAGRSNFILKGAAWAKDGYTHGVSCYNPKDRDSRGPK